uniref:Uncharacterized protein n=1 Tax=Globisporangium ultimum (strain ATCC 200006 / CBS 805.95 / DAOM BR144) TaxID=431595 RepID=K3W8Y5_GLOUD
MNWEYMVENFGVLPGLAMDKLHVRWGTAIGSKMLCIWRVRRTFALDSGASVILLVSYINPVDATFGEPISYGFLLEERQWKISREHGDPIVGYGERVRTSTA